MTLAVSYSDDNKARIQWNHIDGPMLVCRDGTPHWLSKFEILWLRLGLTTIEELDAKFCSKPQQR